MDERRGTFANGMEFVAVGDGPRTVLLIPGGPGSMVPSRLELRLTARTTRPYHDAGMSVWTVTRARGMPTGTTLADMADDYADVVRSELGGRVDVVVGVSYGGMVAQLLAARHPEVLSHLVLVCAAATATTWGTAVDHRLAVAVAEGRDGDAGAAFLEYVLPGRRRRHVRRALGPLVGRLLVGDAFPRHDALVEANAEVGFDARPLLARIAAPTLLVAGDDDLFFSPAAVAETARRLPDATLVRYAGWGHVRLAASARVARDVVDFVDISPAPPPTA